MCRIYIRVYSCVCVCVSGDRVAAVHLHTRRSATQWNAFPQQSDTLATSTDPPRRAPRPLTVSSDSSPPQPYIHVRSYIRTYINSKYRPTSAIRLLCPYKCKPNSVSTIVQYTSLRVLKYMISLFRSFSRQSHNNITQKSRLAANPNVSGRVRFIRRIVIEMRFTKA